MVYRLPLKSISDLFKALSLRICDIDLYNQVDGRQSIWGVILGEKVERGIVPRERGFYVYLIDMKSLIPTAYKYIGTNEPKNILLIGGTLSVVYKDSSRICIGMEELILVVGYLTSTGFCDWSKDKQAMYVNYMEGLINAYQAVYYFCSCRFYLQDDYSNKTVEMMCKDAKKNLDRLESNYPKGFIATV